MKMSLKTLRNIWIISGCIWFLMFFERLGSEGISTSTIFKGILGIMCIFNAYSYHKRNKNDE